MQFVFLWLQYDIVCIVIYFFFCFFGKDFVGVVGFRFKKIMRFGLVVIFQNVFKCSYVMNDMIINCDRKCISFVRIYELMMSSN